MLLQIPSGALRSGSIALDASSALRTLASVHPAPILLGYHPPSPSPFLSLLYSRAADAGIAAIPLREPAEVRALLGPAALGGARVVLHLHWLNGVLNGVTDEAEAARRIAAFAAVLDGLAADGVAIAWTIHNRLPHGAVMPDAEHALRQEVARRAAVVHVMAAQTEAIVADRLVLDPARLLRVPHPAFAGVYPDWVGRAEARRVLGVLGDAPLVGLVGALQPYKGVTELLDAVPLAARASPGLRVVIAGRPDGSEETEAAIARAIADPRVLVQPRWVAEDRIQHVLRALDAVVLPYRQVLNSAALLLALGFGLPAVVPHDPALAEFEDPAVVVAYERDSSEALAEAVGSALALPREPAAAAARRLLAGREPAEVSRAFADGLRARLA